MSEEERNIKREQARNRYCNTSEKDNMQEIYITR